MRLNRLPSAHWLRRRRTLTQYAILSVLHTYTGKSSGSLASSNSHSLTTHRIAHTLKTPNLLPTISSTSNVYRAATRTYRNGQAMGSKKSVVSLVKREGRDIRYSNLFIHIDCDIRATVMSMTQSMCKYLRWASGEKNLVRFDVRKILLEVSSSVLEFMADELCRWLWSYFLHLRKMYD